MKLVVASTNPVKIQAASQGFLQIFSFTPDTVSLEANSGVSDQPHTDEQTRLGAANRVAFAQSKIPQADYWIGIEGGVHQAPEVGLVSFAWIAIADNKNLAFSRTASITLPQPVVNLIHQGLELGDAMDQVFSRHNSKQQEGAIGLLTSGKITRQELYQPSVVIALSQLINHQTK